MRRDEHTRQVLTWLRDLFALRVIEEDLGWFLENGRISPQRAKTPRQDINRLAGPATLASAIHLMNQVAAWNRGDADGLERLAEDADQCGGQGRRRVDRGHRTRMPL